tara:strand:+ start:1308 stop:1859 length:552 start_codon:yes stop_codon:yes gene_type:complete
MKIKATISIIALLLFGCASNLPYIDMNDALDLEYGMDQVQVENILGPPIKISGNSNEELWQYDFRIMENERLEWMAPLKGDSPQKATKVSEFYCTFTNDELIEWGSCIGNGCADPVNISGGPGFFGNMFGSIMKYKYPILGLIIIGSIISGMEDEDEGYCMGYAGTYKTQYDCENNGQLWIFN